MNDKRRPTEYPQISSLSFLLRLYHVPYTAQEANKILLKKGILIELHRKSLVHKGQIRTFRVLSRKGLKYGSNIKNPVHPLETTVHYCIDAFQVLAEMLIEEHKNNQDKNND